MRPPAVVLCTLALVCAAPLPRPAAGAVRTGLIRTARIRVGRRTRTYRLFVPAAAAGTARIPLVFAYHGINEDQDRFARLTHLEATAREHGFLLVFPNGLERRWDLSPRDNPDVLFFDALYARLLRQYPVDPDRVCATGFSMGAFFINLLGSRRGSRLAAIAPHSGGLGALERTGIHAARKYPVLIVEGAKDPYVKPGEARAELAAYRAEGHPVTYLQIPGLGHAWASAAGINERIWTFFDEHRATEQPAVIASSDQDRRSRLPAVNGD